jgi:hypothetical protein
MSILSILGMYVLAQALGAFFFFGFGMGLGWIRALHPYGDLSMTPVAWAVGALGGPFALIPDLACGAIVLGLIVQVVWLVLVVGYSEIRDLPLKAHFAIGLAWSLSGALGAIMH